MTRIDRNVQKLVIPAKAGIQFFFPNKVKMDYKLHPQFALRAIRCANVRFGILPSQFRFRGNDGKREEPGS